MSKLKLVLYTNPNPPVKDVTPGSGKPGDRFYSYMAFDEYEICGNLVLGPSTHLFEKVEEWAKAKSDPAMAKSLVLDFIVSYAVEKWREVK